MSQRSSFSKSSTHSRILVLCIDRDDDIGSKGGIETPIVGRDHCISAGTRLAIEDPEDSDANAIFGAIKTYEESIAKGYNSEVALVAGKFNRGIEADEKISLEIQNILTKYKADGAGHSSLTVRTIDSYPHHSSNDSSHIYSTYNYQT